MCSVSPDAERREVELKDDNPMYVRDYSKCLLCWRCVQVCADDAQYTYAINFSGRGFETQIGTFFDRSIPETTCVLCGQCVGVCPTGALKPKREYLLQQGISPEEISVMNTGRKRRKEREFRKFAGCGRSAYRNQFVTRILLLVVGFDTAEESTCDRVAFVFL